MKQRNSAIEMLRILSMMMVLMVHFVGATFGLPTREQLYALDSGVLWKDVLESLSIVGVNCFVLISGYYGIKATRRRLLDFTLWCLFASLLAYACRCVEAGCLADGLVGALLVYSKTDLWFVPAYLALFLLSPLLNAGLERLDGRRLHLMLLALIFINVYLGWFHKGGINPTGYNVMQMVFLYVIGHCLHRNLPLLQAFPLWGYLCVYLLSTVAIGLALDFAYNNPFVLLSAVALFMVFVKIPAFSSPAVNWVSVSVFMVYLLHKTPYFWIKLRNSLIGLYEDYDTFGFLWRSLALYVAIFVVCILVDKVRMPVCRWIASQLPSAEVVVMTSCFLRKCGG